MMPYGDFDTMFGTLVKQLESGPYLLGERFSAADLLWGSALTWMTGWKLIPETPAVNAYVERFTARPSFAKVTAKDAEIAAAQAGRHGEGNLRKPSCFETGPSAPPQHEGFPRYHNQALTLRSR